MNLNFSWDKISSEIIKDLPQRQKEVIVRRFGLEGKEKETLQTIGRDFGITRERVRQIENAALNKIKKKVQNYQYVFQFLIKKMKEYGNVKKEVVFLNELGKGSCEKEIYFLLNLKEEFQRIKEDNDFYAFWTIDFKSVSLAKEVIHFYINWFQNSRIPKTIKELAKIKNFSLPTKILESYLEISKKVKKNEDGFYGLIEWPEINPRGIRDKAFLVFKKIKKPLHFKEVARFIPHHSVQTVHNELIKDPRFVLIGRGIYGLKEWGYMEGDVKDVIYKILEKAQKPMSKEEILKKVLEQRQVKKSTVFLNLSRKEYFLKNDEGRYIIRENV